MKEFLIYLLETSACMGALYFCFGLFMRKEACFGLNRAALLLIVAVSLSVPLLPVPYGAGWQRGAEMQRVTPQTRTPFAAESLPAETGDGTVPVPRAAAPETIWEPVSENASGWSAWFWLACLYWAGVSVVTVRAAWRILGTVGLVRTLKGVPFGKCRLIVLPADVAACSLGKYIVISQYDYEHCRREILTHELAHRHFRHLFDLSFLGLAQAFLWFNPFVYMIRRDMRQVHEFQADRYTLDRGVEARGYQMLVIRKCVGEKPFALATGFYNDCPVKKRIRMMNLRPSRRAAWKALAYLPVLLGLAVAFGRPVETAAARTAIGVFAGSVCLEGLPHDWFVAGTTPERYDIGIDPSGTKDGKPAVTLRRNGSSYSAGGFGTLMQSCLPDKYRGKRVRMTGYLRSNDVSGWAGLWLRADGELSRDGDVPMLAFDNMGDRPVRGTTPWRKYELVLDIPANAASLSYGVLLSGAGQVWAAGLSFEEVDRSVPVTERTTTGI